MNKSINMGKRCGLGLLAALVALIAALVPAVASADFGVQPGGFQSNILDGGGATLASPQAGAHPYAQQIKLAFKTKQGTYPGAPGGQYPPSGPDPDPDGEAKTIITSLPAGFLGNPQAVPQCEQRDFPPEFFGGYSRCATASQVGVASLDLGQLSGYPYAPGSFKVPVYNLTPPKGVVARLGFVEVAAVVIDITIRTGSDYGITATIRNLSEAPNIYASTVTLWGVPADSSHDAERYRPGAFGPGDANGQPLASGLPLTPFLTNPAQCDGPVTTGLSVDSWQDPGKFLSYTSTPVQYSGCDRLTLQSSLAVTPTSAGAGEPTGIAVDLNVDQPQAPNALGSPPLKKVSVTLPEGVTVSPSSADGLGACTPTQIGLGNDADPSCPDSSKVGSVQIDTPLLGEPLLGSVYLAEPGQGNNPFSSLVALYIVAKASGVLVKLPGVVALDPVTGRVVSTFDNTPQLPFSRLHVAFKGGARAPLSQANTCGVKTTSAVLTSWGGQVVNVAGDYNVGVGAGSPSCDPQGFAPQMTAGSLSSAAGASTPFSFRLTRTDADQQLSAVTTVLPEGLLANVKDVALCPEAQAAAGSCGPESLIGRVTVGSGPGPSPFYIDNGRAYLTTGYKGAPFGLSIVTRAVAGPFDLGDVIVRAALSIDPVTTRVTVTTDPFPTILQGIPLQLRDVRLSVDRPAFMLNPTSCAAQSIDATVTSTSGTTSSPSNPYQATDCAALPLKPKLALSLTGKGQTTDGKHPGIVAHLTQQPGESRLEKVAVTLPLALALDPDNAQGLCKPEQAAIKACPVSTIVGQAKAVSVLHQPLTGPVYFVEGIRIDPKSGRKIRTLPKLLITLKGEGVEVDLNASSDVDPLGHLVTTFDHIPDAPISAVDLTIDGGQHGILTVSDADICKSTQIADQQIDGQSAKQSDTTIAIQTPSCLLKVITKKIAKKSVAVKIGGLGAGRVTVTGKGIKKTTKTIATSTVATITAKRTNAKPGKVTVTFDPTGPAKARKTTK
jgi:hypothetical protein